MQFWTGDIQFIFDESYRDGRRRCNFEFKLLYLSFGGNKLFNCRLLHHEVIELELCWTSKILLFQLRLVRRRQLGNLPRDQVHFLFINTKLVISIIAGTKITWVNCINFWRDDQSSWNTFKLLLVIQQKVGQTDYK